MSYARNAVVKGPDVFGPHSHRPYVCLSDNTHPFSDEEALYAAVMTTRRSAAIPLAEADFTSGGFNKASYVNLWTIMSESDNLLRLLCGSLTDINHPNIVNIIN